MAEKNFLVARSQAPALVDYTSVRGPSFRHGCRNPASKDGKLGATTDVPATTNMGWHVTWFKHLHKTCYHPWPGFRHPCRNDGL